MPVNFLSAAERFRLSHFPQDISEADLIQYFTLTSTDLKQVQQKRQLHNRLGFALQLCALRYMGFCPDNLQQTPAAIAMFVSQQLGTNIDVLRLYGQRRQTRTQHVQQAQDYLGFCSPNPENLKKLGLWLVERALEHDRPSLLFQLAAQNLFQKKWVRPGVTVLERMVSTARHQAMKETYKRIKPLLTRPVREFLRQLLKYNSQIDAVRLSWLRRPATSHSPKAIVHTADKIRFLRTYQVEQWNLSSLNPNRLRFLARLAKKTSLKGLRRMPIERRYPLLVAFVSQSLVESTDELADLFIRCLADTQARATNDLKAFRQREAVAINEKVRILKQLGGVILDPLVEDPQVRAGIFEKVTPEQLDAAVNDCERLVRPSHDDSCDYFAARYSYIRQFAPTLLETFALRSNRQQDPLLEAITLLRRLNQMGKRQVPESAPMAFVTTPWKPYIRDQDDQIQRRYYELCVLWQLRHSLRSGDLWLEDSRRYANPESYLISQQQWSLMRSEFCQRMSLPQQGQVRLQQLGEKLDIQMNQLAQTLADHPHIRLVDEQVVVSPLQAQGQSERLKSLKSLIDRCLPQVELTDLLIEVDLWTGFSQHLVHSGGHQSRSQETDLYLYAALLAQACNLGPVAMARVADVSYERLVWHTHWFLDDDTLARANTALVNYHHQLPLAQIWGGGTLSSSDGQRFPVAVKNTQAVALPKYFGYGKGVTFYTWLSDQFSVFGTKVIPSTSRDATYVLDGIQDNETELEIVEHTTDTAGYTEVLFALFDLCGLQFSPRIRDLADQKLYRLKNKPDALIKALFDGRINYKLIEEAWDEMLRIAASLEHGWVTSSLLISKLSSFTEPNRLLRALQEYGRLVKTIFILRYYNSLDYRQQINRQLNKGEAVHALRRYLTIARQGQLRQRHQEGLENQASCLTLVTNAVVLWNTVYIQAALDYIRQQGYQVHQEDIPHLSPARFEHINPYGKYRFEIDKNKQLQGLRPLRLIKTAR